MDTHIYQMFSQEEVSQSQSAHIAVCILWSPYGRGLILCQSACAQGANVQSLTSLWTVVGEWTTASTDCAKYLNGRGLGARFDGTFPGSTRVGSCTGQTGSRSTFSSSLKTFMRQYFEAQVSCWCFA